MNFSACRIALLSLIVSLAVLGRSQQINSSYAELSIPGNWQTAKHYATSQVGADAFYDQKTGSVVLISQQPGMHKVGEIAAFFTAKGNASKQAAQLIASAQFPLPTEYTLRVSKDLVKGTKPPKIWDLKEGEGNPGWFYASQLFDEYRVRDVGGSSEVTEEFLPVKVTKAEQRSIRGGDVLLIEAETEKPANEAALKRFHMPPEIKDQRIRYGWVQFAPGGIGAGQGVLSVAFATGANSNLTVDDVVKQVSSTKINLL